MSNDKIRRWVRPDVLATRSYHVQDSAGLIKLDAMENPYAWPDEIKQGWLRCLAEAEINRYPSPDAAYLKTKLRRAFALPDDAGLLLGNGSDEIIQIIALAFAAEHAVFLTPEPSFVMYEVIAGSVRARFRGIPLRQDFSLDRDAMLEAIGKYQPAVVFLAYPNNPTANLFNSEVIVEIIRHAPGIVVVDEAYHVFAGNSFLPKIGEFDNLLVMRTLSKLGLAGLRLGLLAGPENWLREFDKVRLPYNINLLTQMSAAFILDHIDVLLEQAGRIRRDRGSLYSALQAMPGIRVWPSSANFLLFRTEQADSSQVFADLKKAGILVKNLNNSHPLVRGCLRVTVGTESENQAFLAALEKILQR